MSVATLQWRRVFAWRLFDGDDVRVFGRARSGDHADSTMADAEARRLMLRQIRGHGYRTDGYRWWRGDDTGDVDVVGTLYMVFDVADDLAGL